MNDNAIQFPDVTPASLIPGEGTFELKIGGTTYEVNTHFSTEGRQSVLEQFMALIMNDHLI